ncbi:hypothetical protein KFU94_04000 [Chloroflexi bacterium TSY]|nr:hypothetical protein [Chloroflexi bacterium TSY]
MSASGCSEHHLQCCDDEYGGAAYSYDVEATGNPAPTYSLTSPPVGMIIDTNSGLISWTPP